MLSESKQSTVASEKELKLEDALPYPIKKEGTCSICGRKFEEHHYMDFFIDPSHVKTIREFFDLLNKKHDETESIYLKMGMSASSSVLTPKEMVETLKELGQSNPAMANRMVPIFSHYIPSEKFKYKTEVGIGRKLFAVRSHFDALCLMWETDLMRHIELYPEDKEEGKEKALLKKVLLENVVVEKNAAYEKFLSVHKYHAEQNYRYIQRTVHVTASKVMANSVLAKTLFNTRFSKWKASITEKANKRRLASQVKVKTG